MKQWRNFMQQNQLKREELKNKKYFNKLFKRIKLNSLINIERN